MNSVSHSSGGSRRQYLLAACALALPLSQVGHALAYLLRSGPNSWRMQSTGVHSYFPEVLKASGELVGVGALVVLAILALGRIAGMRLLGAHRVGRLSALEVASVVFPLQLAIFVAQETTELAAAGRLTALTDVPLLWGVAGQLPVACLAAAMLAWISGRLGLALKQAQWLLECPDSKPACLPVLVTWTAPARSDALVQSAIKIVAKRGPPLVSSRSR